MFAENYQLVVRKGPKPGHVYPLLAPTITIGRDPMSDIVLNDPEVSRYHAQLVETADGYQLQDMGSTNGTYVAGKRIGDQPVLLQPGQDVAFGSGIFLMYEAVGDQTGHHIHRIIVGNRDEIIHLSGTGLPQTFDAHGISLNQSRI